MRKPMMAGNWKMTKTVDESVEFVQAIRPRVAQYENVDIVVCPPFVALHAVSGALRGSNLFLGAQNVHWAESGAWTGEIAPGMLEGIAGYAIVGHSERAAGIVVACEPIWAIGTGLSATPEMANQVCGPVGRGTLDELYGDQVAQKIHGLYGGSASEKNSGDLMALPDNDGALIGGASLKAGSFVDMICITSEQQA